MSAEFDSPRKRKQLTPKEAKLKAADFCAYQERSQQQVRDKLYEYGLYQDEVEDTLADLIVEGFLNEERFARSYVRGKFRMNKWGRVKIMQGLHQHKISEYCIKKGFEEIEQNEYHQVLTSLIEAKLRSIKPSNDFDRRNKLARYAIGKGFESDLVWEVIKDDLKL